MPVFILFCSIKMKSAIIGLLALCCMVGMALGQWGYGYGGRSPSASGFGSGMRLSLSSVVFVIKEMKDKMV